MFIILTEDLSRDEILVAYLDNELRPEDRRRVEGMIAGDASLAARMAELAIDRRSLCEGFEEVLAQAPRERLSAMIPQKAPADAQIARRRSLGALAAGVAGLLVGGIGAEAYHWWDGQGPQAEARRWREGVSGYMHLYTAATFADLGDTPELRADQFRVVSDALALQVTEASIALPGVAFRRAELLSYNGKPLAQIGYVDPKYGPMAFCLKPADFGTVAPCVDQQRGMNIVYWSTERYGYLVIGRNPVSQLQAFASTLRSRIAA